MPKYYEISEAAAKRAKDMNSYSDYAPGSATAGYRAMVDEAYALAEKQKAQVDPMYHDKIDALVDRYAAGWRKTSTSATPLMPVCRLF